jgi:hypothetical protein
MTNEIASVCGNIGPPFNAMKRWPKISKSTVTSVCGSLPGVSTGVTQLLIMRLFGNTLT